MENLKNNKLLAVLLVIFVISTLILGGFALYDKVLSNDNSEINNNLNSDVNNNSNSVTNDNITGTTIDNVVIKNSEVKELYNYVQASLNSNSLCLGYYYQNPFKNHSLKDKIALVLLNYGKDYRKKINDEFLNKIPYEQRQLVKNSSIYYIDANTIKEGMKLIFNIDVTNFEEGNYQYYHYISEADAFVDGSGGGSYDAMPVQQIIEYNESSTEINLTVVKAEVGYDKNIYRFINNKDSLVYLNTTKENFKFTKENVNKFPQLKYIFKLNASGKYYVSDIINLNFEEDFVKCN